MYGFLHFGVKVLRFFGDFQDPVLIQKVKKSKVERSGKVKKRYSGRVHHGDKDNIQDL